MADTNQVVFDARTFAEGCSEAIFNYSMEVASYWEDIEAALDAMDYATALECVALGFAALGRCRLMVTGVSIDAIDGRLIATLAFNESMTNELPELPVGESIDRETADAWYRRFLNECESFASSLPVTCPQVRTPEGFFPTLKVLRQFESLKSALGLDPTVWDFGT